MILRIIIDLLMVCGLYFALAGTKGILKMPDTFCRMQASTCVSTLGVIGVALGGLIHAIFAMGSASTAVKIAVICLLILIPNPVGSPAIAKGAYKAGIRPETPMETDDLGRDNE